jgi:hypothetical protein
LRKAVFLLAVLCLPLASSGALAWNQSEITWYTITTEHFCVQYHAGLERYAEQAAAIAETVYGPITEMYGYKPSGKIYLNLSDLEDESQGTTYYYLNRIDLTATPYDFWFRGSAAWIANVITHEFTHMVSVQSSFKYPRRIPSLYLQAVNFEKEKRPDVIYGYPNFQMSVPIPGEILPGWFAEGLAQYQSSGACHDMWDSHRDMMLRTAFVSGKLLTIDEMGVFGKNSLYSEMVYNQGFALAGFVARRFGADKLRELALAFSSLRTWGFDGACERTLGMSDEKLYRMWKDDLSERYAPVLSRVRAREVSGEKIAGEGFQNHFPVPGGNAGELYFISNRGRDYSDMDLMRKEGAGREKPIVSNVSSRFDISPDGARICFSRKTRSNDHGYLRNDLYLYDLRSKKEKRLTHGARATNPTWSPDGTKIACVVTGEGSQRIALVDASDGTSTVVTPSASQREYMGLSWGAGGILATRFEGSSRDIVLLDPASGVETEMVATEADERDPRWNDDGGGFFYASDRTGIFNIYYHPMDGSGDSMVTNCIGGAFEPAPTGADLMFTGYGGDGFEIRRIDGWNERAVAVDTSLDDGRLSARRMSIAGTTMSCPAGAVLTAAFDSAAADTAEPGKKFGIEYTPTFVYPRFMIFQGKPRLGVFLDTGDYLGRQSVFAGGSVAANGEFDLNLSVETRQFKPTLGLEVYRSRTHYGYQDTLEVDPDHAGVETCDLNVRYDLWDAYFTVSMEFKPTTSFSRNEAVLQYNHGEYGVNIEVWELAKQREFKGEVGWNYYIADELSLLWHYKDVREEVDADINPRGGRILDVEVTKAFDKLHSGEFASGLFRPIYDKDYFGRYTFHYQEFVPLPFWRHALSLEARGGAIDRTAINDFFYLYLGGRDGLRGYTYYSLGGTKMALGRLTYRFPVWRGINRQAAVLYLGSLYAGIFAEAGKAWTANDIDLNGNQKDVGFDMRFKGFTFYSYPVAASFEAAYSLNDVTYTAPFTGEVTVYEKNDWKLYGSVLFSF